MHFLIGFGILVGLVAFAFGRGSAAAFVRGALVLAATAIFAIIAFLAVTAWNELQPTRATKHPRPSELTGPPGDEPRCGYACANARDGISPTCWNWIDIGTPQTAECKNELGREARQ